MIRKYVPLFLILLLAGCVYEGKPLGHYIENPGSLMEDPHFAEYQKKRDVLESEYLQKKITYAEYMESKNKLDEKYAQEVQERNAKIISQE